MKIKTETKTKNEQNKERFENENKLYSTKYSQLAVFYSDYDLNGIFTFFAANHDGIQYFLLFERRINDVIQQMAFIPQIVHNVNSSASEKKGRD